MASNGPCPHLHSLCLGLATHQPSRRQYAQSLLGPSLFHDPRTPHVLESHPERAVPLSRRDDERQHAIGLHSAIALRLLQPATPLLVVDFQHVCSNVFQPFQSC